MLLVVNYHYYRETRYKGGIYPINKAKLDQQTDQLAQQQYRFVDQQTLLDWRERGVMPEGKYCLLTFDDGLKEQMEAFDHLQRRGIPALFFIPGWPLRERRVLPTHQLHLVRTILDDQEIYALLEQRSGIADYPFDEAALANQYRYDDPMARKVKYYLNFALDTAEKTAITQALFDTLGIDERAFADQCYMDSSDLRRLTRAGALGAHGDQHLALATLSPEEAEQDIVRCMQYLEQETGQAPLAFSYPFGGASATGPQLLPLLSRHGIQLAFTMQRGVNTHLDAPLLLQRIDTNDLDNWL